MITARRIISFVANICILLGGIYLIIKVQDNEGNVIDWIKINLEYYEQKYLLKFVNIFPSLIISLLNFTLPTLTKLIVQFEKWDFPEEAIKNEIWRIYI